MRIAHCALHTTLLLSSSQHHRQQILESLKMAKMIFVLALMVAVASTQPIETIATSGGVSLSTQLWNWGQATFEALLELAKCALGNCREEIVEIPHFNVTSK